MMVSQQTATVVTLTYDDLLAFDPAQPDAALMEQVGKAFGPEGLGILAVSDVPDFGEKRQALLPLAAKLPSLPDLDSTIDAASLYSVGWSHGKEQLAPGKPDFAKGSYYANPLTENLAAAMAARDGTLDKTLVQEHPEFFAVNIWPASLPELKIAFQEMGQLLQSVGCLLAAVCDAYCKRHGVKTALADTLRHSLNAKGRLLHYFAVDCGDSTLAKPWCGWHNDHGSLTGLVPGMYLDESGKQVSCPDAASGLYIQSRSGEQVRVSIPAIHCAFQIGETSQIQSGGLLQATPHAVMVAGTSGITRESFAVFLEPEFNSPLNIPVGKTVDDCQGVQDSELGLQPLKTRWQQGQTFGDFHLATVSAFAVTD